MKCASAILRCINQHIVSHQNKARSLRTDQICDCCIEFMCRVLGMIMDQNILVCLGP